LSVRPNFLDIHASAARTGRALLPASLFRTHDLPLADRFEAWRESVGVFLDCRLDPRSGTEDFNGQVESYLLDDLMLSRCTANHQKFDRPSLKIARDDIDHYMVQLFLTGGTEMRLGRRAIGSTRLIGFDLADVLDSFNADFDLVAVLVPRARLAPLLRFPDSLHGAMPITEDGAGGLLANFLKDVFEILPALAPGQAASVARSLVELIAAAFNGAHFPANDMPALAERALQLRARLHVKARLSERDLDPEDIARALGVSRSALYRLFRQSGGIAQYIREQRLRRCFGELAAGSGGMQVAQIAYRWGFSDAAHFSRLFRQRFGCTPSETQERATAAMARGDFDPRVGDRRYESWIAGLA
jgi:AraC-like DNA-binding protein